MRIAVPVSNDRTAETLSGIEGFQFFEDDHGRIVRRFFVPRAGEGAAAAVAQLSVLLLTERQGRLRQRLTQKSVPHRGTLFSYSPQVRLRLPEVTSTGGLAER